MSLRLTKPGQFAADQMKDLEILLRRSGENDDDPNDPAFTGEDDEDDDEEDSDDEDEDEDDKPKGKKSKKSKKDDEDDDEDDDDVKPTRPERQAAKYRTERNALREQNRQLEERLRKIENKDKPADEVISQDLTEARAEVQTLSEVNRVMSAQLAFFKVNTIDWADSGDAFDLAERDGLFDDAIDEDGTVDKRSLRAALKDLAKRKPHLVKKAKTESADDEDDDNDDEPRSRRSAPKVNGKRKGSKGDTPDRARLAKSFPVLNRL